MADTHERIIGAAKELFEKNGFAAATTKEIADLAGVSEVTLFRHFENKRRLFEETLHSCIHPYRIDEYLENEAAYDLEVDLKKIAYNMLEAYSKNAPTLRMIMRDKIRNSAHEVNLKKSEHHSEQTLVKYFEAMKRKGKTDTDPVMATKFYVSNIAGYLMKDIMSGQKSDKIYFAWMLDKVISVLKSSPQG
jgi:TetR/AcrR family transcriptional regulator, mexJK operon transcriptional repressor